MPLEISWRSGRRGTRSTQPVAVAPHNSTASARTRWATRGRSPRSVMTSTSRCRRSSRSLSRPPRSIRLRPGSRSTRKSTSLASVASPRATEPKTRTCEAPRASATSMISSRRWRSSASDVVATATGYSHRATRSDGDPWRGSSRWAHEPFRDVADRIRSRGRLRPSGRVQPASLRRVGRTSPSPRSLLRDVEQVGQHRTDLGQPQVSHVHVGRGGIVDDPIPTGTPKSTRTTSPARKVTGLTSCHVQPGPVLVAGRLGECRPEPTLALGAGQPPDLLVERQAVLGAVGGG